MAETGRNISKTRNWSSIVYPESAPDCWRDLLADTHIPALISPLHDRDEAADGTMKKPHYHIVIMSDGPITQKRANEIFEPLCGTKSAERILSLKGYVRYLAHLDDPDKAQYDPADIIALSGADLADLLKPSRSDRFLYLGEIIDFCEEYSMYEFCGLLQYARRERPDDWFPVLVENPYLINRYLTSLRYSEGYKREH
jgi:hypothetical protein